MEVVCMGCHLFPCHPYIESTTVLSDTITSVFSLPITITITITLKHVIFTITIIYLKHVIFTITITITITMKHVIFTITITITPCLPNIYM